MIKLNAPITPGKSAAGVDLGVNKTDISNLFHGATEWDQMVPTHEIINRTALWVRVPNKRLDSLSGIVENYYYAHGAVRLAFNIEGTLIMIGVGDGYTGRLFDEVKVGDRLDAVLRHVDLCYDEADELHFALVDQQEIGLCFYAEEKPLAAAPDQTIQRIFINS